MSRPERWNHWAVERLPCKFYNDDDHDTYPVVSVPGAGPFDHPDHRHHWRPPASSVYVSSGKQEQDARLMASAPDLLAACEEAARAIESYCEDHAGERPTDVTVVLPALLSAIAKAGGVK